MSLQCASPVVVLHYYHYHQYLKMYFIQAEKTKCGQWCPYTFGQYTLHTSGGGSELVKFHNCQEVEKRRRRTLCNKLRWMQMM